MTLRNIITALTLSASLSAAAQEASLVVGNCSAAGASQLEYVGAGTGAGFAVNMNRYKMRAYKGCQISAINIECSSSAKGHIFIRKGINDTPLYTQDFELQYGWNEVRLTTPYPLDGTELTFGYELDALSDGTLVYGTTLVEGNEYINRGKGWEHFTAGSGRVTALVTGDHLPAADVAIDNVQMQQFVTTGSNLATTAEIVNLGTETVKSISVNYHNDAETISTEVSGLNIAPRTKKSISLSLPLNAEGDYNFWLEVTAANGKTDAAPIDNSSAKHEVFVRDAFVQRNVLLEVFSTEKCTNCPEGHRTLEATLGDKPHIIEMTHHAGFYTDQFTIPESTEYEWLFKTPQYNTTFAPAFTTDRTAWTAYPEYYTYGAPVAMTFNSRALTAAYNSAVSVPALATISVSPDYDAATRSLTVSVDATTLIATEGYDRPTLNVFLVEDQIPSMEQTNANGIYIQRHVVRKCLTPTWGDPIAARATTQRTYSATLDEKWKADKMSIVVFVANYNAASNADCRVMNAEEVTLDGVSSSVSNVSLDRPSSNIIYNAQGQRVSATAVATGANLQPGFYVQDGRKFIVR